MGHQPPKARSPGPGLGEGCVPGWPRRAGQVLGRQRPSQRPGGSCCAELALNRTPRDRLSPVAIGWAWPGQRPYLGQRRDPSSSKALGTGRQNSSLPLEASAALRHLTAWHVGACVWAAPAHTTRQSRAKCTGSSFPRLRSTTTGSPHRYPRVKLDANPLPGMNPPSLCGSQTT